MASFCSGNFDFIAISAHVRWGTSNVARQAEISRFAEWLKKKTERKEVADSDVIVFGDFNTEGQGMIDDLLQYGLKIPEPLIGARTNVKQTQHYDHILFLPKFTDFRSFTNHGGVLKAWQGIGQQLFPGESDEAITYLLSDHFPIWMKLKTDNDQEKRDQLIQNLRMGDL
jgi:exonuclease III